MKVPLSWLKEFVSLGPKIKVETLADKLTFAGFEVEAIDRLGDETVLEINVTPNRGDCLSIYGMAREVGVLFGVPCRPMMSLPSHKKPKKNSVKSPMTVSVKDKKKCPRYTLAVLSGVHVVPSPAWLVKRLEAVGIRSINNVVDVTNYVLMELGQPLHAFDVAKLRGGHLVVRRALSGETILTLDGEERHLVAEDLVIADGDGPVAIAGVMGGGQSEVIEETTMIALEAAYFEPGSVRKTSRRLGLQTESSYRFERGIDPMAVRKALGRAIEMIGEIAGGVLQDNVVDIDDTKLSRRSVSFSPSTVHQLLGFKESPPRILKILQDLSFQVRPGGKDRWKVEAPSWRRDVEESADLVEEVARISGLEKIPVTFPAMTVPPLEVRRDSSIRSVLSSFGLKETVHFSFVSPEDIERLDPGLLQGAPILSNPLSRDESLLRPSLFPSLLKTASYHHHHKIHDFSLFELRPIFKITEKGVASHQSLAVLLSGSSPRSHWSQGHIPYDFFDAKGLAESVLSSQGAVPAAYSPSSFGFLHPGKQASILLKGQTVGFLGEVHPLISQRFDLTRSVFLLELDWEKLSAFCRSRNIFKDFSRFPVVERDLAVVVDQSVPAGTILETIRTADHRIVEAGVFDVYQGGQIAAGKKSLAFSLQLALPDRTLTDEEVGQVMSGLWDNLKQTYKAEGR